MTLGALLQTAYAWLVSHQLALFAAAVALPVTGVLVSLLVRSAGRNGRRAAQRMAGWVLWAALAVLVLAVIALAVARTAFDANLINAPVLLLLSPVLCAATAVTVVHWAYPLHQLAAWRTLTDIGWFVLACAVVIWLVSKFRGWGILFGGSLLELAAIIGFGYWFLRRLYRRAFN